MTLIVAKLVTNDYLIVGADCRLVDIETGNHRDDADKLFLVGQDPDCFLITWRGDFVSTKPSWTATGKNIGGWLSEWAGRRQNDKRSLDRHLEELKAELSIPLSNTSSAKPGYLIVLGWISGELVCRSLRVNQRNPGSPEFVPETNVGLISGYLCQWPPTLAVDCDVDSSIRDVATMRQYIARFAEYDRTGTISRDMKQTVVAELRPGRTSLHGRL
jgi:hypothetical protein